MWGGGIMTDRDMLSARVPSELKDLVDADPRTNQEIIEAALWREFGGRREGAIERQIKEMKQRRAQVVSEREAREEELADIDQTIAELQEKLELAKVSRKTRVREAVETMDWLHPDELTDPIIENWSDKTDIPRSEFEDVYREVWNDEGRD
jgi:hypothetical protein